MAAILNSAILNFAILDFSHSFWLNSSAILPYCISSHKKTLTHSLCSRLAAILNSTMLGFRHCHFAQKKLHCLSFWLILMIQPSWILSHVRIWLPSWIQPSCYLCHLGFSSKILTCTQTLTQTHSIWLKLIHSHLIWWCQPSWILVILDSTIFFHRKKLQDHSFCTQKLHDGSLIFNSTMLESGNLPSWIQTPCYLLSDSLKNTHMPLWLWLKLIQSDPDSFILT